MSNSRPLTKLLFSSGSQCAKRLYLDYHFPEETPGLSPQRQAMAAAGLQMVELARRGFPRSESVDPDDIDVAIGETTELLDQDDEVVIFDAAFRFDGVEIRCDVVIWHPDRGVDIFEVKSGTKVKSRHIQDVALQMYVVEGCGHKVSQATVLHLNAQYRHPGGDNYAVHKLFCYVDVTEKARAQLDAIAETTARFRNLLDDPATQELPTGTWCRSPFRCGHLSTCRQDGPENPLVDLPELMREQEEALHLAGIEDIADIDPSEKSLSDLQRRALLAVAENRLVVEELVEHELEEIEYPLRFLSIGSLLQVLPLFAHARPWQRIPLQWTCLTVAEDGSEEIESFVSSAKGDPRVEFVDSLHQALRREGTLVVYGPEVHLALRGLLDDLHDKKPQIRSMLNVNRFDLGQFLRAGAYHPGFRASFDLPRVYEALAGDRKVIKSLHDGINKSGAAFERLLNSRTRATTRQKLGRELEAYGLSRCRAMAHTFEALKAATD